MGEMGTVTGIEGRGKYQVLKLTVEQFAEGCAAYIAALRGADKKKVPTINGLCIHLDISKSTMFKYKSLPGYSEVAAGVLTEIEAWWEAKLATAACTGAIFWLKNQGWTDKTQTEITGDLVTRNLTNEQLDERIAQLMTNVPLMKTINAKE
jgi:hypothetical protein